MREITHKHSKEEPRASKEPRTEESAEQTRDLGHRTPATKDRKPEQKECQHKGLKGSHDIRRSRWCNQQTWDLELRTDRHKASRNRQDVHKANLSNEEASTLDPDRLKQSCGANKRASKEDSDRT